METITLGGGCFWCIEAILQRLKGVEELTSGYAGGETKNPTYEQVCSGTSGHAEVVQIHFDPTVVPLHDLLVIFMTLHDPTTLNRQGNDVGTQYRSSIFYSTPEQKEIAQKVIEEMSDQGIWEDPIVTTIEALAEFYPAEDYHQRYFERNESMAYCQFIIQPKVLKLRKEFQSRLK